MIDVGAGPPGVEARIAEVRARIASAAARAGRDPAEITLVAATKTVDAERVAAALACGVVDLGENRAQELLEKAPVLAEHDPAPRWHFLGAVQRNKVRVLAPWVCLWQSVDRIALGQELAKRAAGARVLVEVNVGEEPQKAGCPPDETEALVDALRELGLTVEGLMAVPPHDDDPRRWFARPRGLGEAVEAPALSMGMTDDFEVAVEEGATIVRVGRALFGARPR
jgi:pyridoxal phosphate enzyme (YggS family)